MRSGDIPFKFDLSELRERGQRLRNKVGNVTINLPFVSFSVNPKNQEKQVAREIIIRLRDRRVLSAWECCDTCINNALASLQEIRRVLVDKQVQLSDVQDGSVYLLIDAMLIGIRQFMTYEELLRRDPDAPGHLRFDQHFLPEHQQGYFDGLEVLRGHLSRSLGQLAAVAGMDPPSDGLIANYQGPWDSRAYLDKPEQ